MELFPQAPAARQVHQSVHADSHTLRTGVAVASPSRIAAQACHQPVGFAQTQVPR